MRDLEEPMWLEWLRVIGILAASTLLVLFILAACGLSMVIAWP